LKDIFGLLCFTVPLAPIEGPLYNWPSNIFLAQSKKILKSPLVLEDVNPNAHKMLSTTIVSHTHTHTHTHTHKQTNKQTNKQMNALMQLSKCFVSIPDEIIDKDVRLLNHPTISIFGKY